MEESNVSSVAQEELKAIIDRLDYDEGAFASDAVEEARKRSKEITPLLIRLVQDATHDCREGYLHRRNGHFYGIYLLAEFRAVEAWPAIRDAISLPDDKPYELFGDAITEDFGCMIATLAAEGFEGIDELIADQSVDLYVRWAACDTFLYRIRDGLLTKEEAITRLSNHLEKAIENKDEVAEGLVMRLEDLGAEGALPLIERAFAAGVIDEELYPLDEVKENIAKGNVILEETMARLQSPDDLIDHVKRWTDFTDGSTDHDFEDDFEDDVDSDETFESYGDEFLPENETTVRSEGFKIGRNEKCPCGSGKKFKKCCGAASNRGFCR